MKLREIILKYELGSGLTSNISTTVKTYQLNISF